ncbi:MAG: CoA transferase [Acidimicrobiales bacterium]|nr:CoA transferase [Acidimicrobiales bacterium]
MQDGPRGPLVGLRILDLTHALAGPFGSMMLADLGADVIKVEPPAGELVRFNGPFTRDDDERQFGSRFGGRNRNKRCIALDLNDDGDRELFFQLVKTADGLIENQRSGVLDRLGAGYEACRARNPRLVYAAVRGFGDPRTGESPYASWPAFDPIAQAMGGIVASTGVDEEHLLRCGPPIGDTVPGLMAAMGMLAAIHYAQRTGVGQFLDVAMVDAMMSMSSESMTSWSYTGRPQRPAGNTVDGLTPFDIYRTADGHCAIAAPTPPQWALLCELIGRPDLITDERTAHIRQRLKHRDVVDDAVGGWARARTNAEVIAVLGDAVPVGPVYGPADWVHDPHVAAREMLVAVEHPHHRPTVHVNCPIRFTQTPAGVYRRAGTLDQDGDDLRAELAARRAAAGAEAGS